MNRAHWNGTLKIAHYSHKLHTDKLGRHSRRRRWRVNYLQQADYSHIRLLNRSTFGRFIIYSLMIPGEPFLPRRKFTGVHLPRACSNLRPISRCESDWRMPILFRFNFNLAIGPLRTAVSTTNYDSWSKLTTALLATNAPSWTFFHLPHFYCWFWSGLGLVDWRRNDSRVNDKV